MKSTACLAALLAMLTLPALAEKSKTDAPPPPDMTNVDAGTVPDEEPQITIRHKGEDSYKEYRIRGELYMIKVTPRIGPPYYLVSRERGGAFERVDDLNRARMVSQWVLLKW